jgi:hypothetical protein
LGNYGDHRCNVARGGGERWRIFLSSPLRTSSRTIRIEKLKSHMTYLAGSHILRSWPGIWLTIFYWITCSLTFFYWTTCSLLILPYLATFSKLYPGRPKVSIPKTTSFLLTHSNWTTSPVILSYLSLTLFCWPLLYNLRLLDHLFLNHAQPQSWPRQPPAI